MRTRASSCGAGDQDNATVTVLELYVHARAKMPKSCINAVDSWSGGYEGADTNRSCVMRVASRSNEGSARGRGRWRGGRQSGVHSSVNWDERLG